MKVLSTLVLAAAIITLGVIGYAYSGLHDISASSSHSGMARWLLSTTADASIERHAGATRPDAAEEHDHSSHEHDG